MPLGLADFLMVAQKDRTACHFNYVFTEASKKKMLFL
jgi:hypothetical protein